MLRAKAVRPLRVVQRASVAAWARVLRSTRCRCSKMLLQCACQSSVERSTCRGASARGGNRELAAGRWRRPDGRAAARAAAPRGAATHRRRRRTAAAAVTGSESSSSRPLRVCTRKSRATPAAAPALLHRTDARVHRQALPPPGAPPLAARDALQRDAQASSYRRCAGGGTRAAATCARQHARQ